MTESRKFYRTVIQIEVLSEEPLSDPDNLESVLFEITDGGCSGATKVIETQATDGKRMAELLQAQGSDPEFFQIDANGNEVIA